MLPELALAGLRAVDEAGLKDRVMLETSTDQRFPGGKIVTTWVAEAEQSGRLNPLALNSPERANQPSAARRWVLSLRSGSVVVPGQRAMVRGTTNGQTWQRLVFVDEVLFPRSQELRRRSLCSDVEANP